MKRLHVFASLLLVFLVFSSQTSAQDATMVGVEKGYQFVYEYSDTIPVGDDEISRLIYVEDSSGNKVYPGHGQEVSFTIDRAPSASQTVVFLIETSDGDIRLQDRSDTYGQFLLFTDWNYWAGEVTSDTKVFDTDEVVTVVNNSTHFGSYHLYEFNASFGDSYTYLSFSANFIYDKDTGMINDLSMDSFTDYGNGTTDGFEYGIELLSQTLGDDGTNLANIANAIILLVIIGIPAYILMRRRQSARTGMQQPANYQYTAPHGTSPQQATPRFCKGCGQALEPANKFCTGCGRQLQ